MRQDRTGQDRTGEEKRREGKARQDYTRLHKTCSKGLGLSSRIKGLGLRTRVRVRVGAYTPFHP